MTNFSLHKLINWLGGRKFAVLVFTELVLRGMYCNTAADSIVYVMGGIVMGYFGFNVWEWIGNGKTPSKSPAPPTAP